MPPAPHPDISIAPHGREANPAAICGAKTRDGAVCTSTELAASGRCRLHGGASTGPRTPEGKQRAACNGLQPKAKRTRREAAPIAAAPAVDDVEARLRRWGL